MTKSKANQVRPIHRSEITVLTDTFAKVYPQIKRNGLSKKAALPIFNKQLKADLNSARANSTSYQWEVLNKHKKLNSPNQLDTLFREYQARQDISSPDWTWPIHGNGNRLHLERYLVENKQTILHNAMTRSRVADNIDRELGIRYTDGMIQDCAREVGIVWRNGKAVDKATTYATIKPYEVPAKASPKAEYAWQVSFDKDLSKDPVITQTMSAMEQTNAINAMKSQVASYITTIEQLVRAVESIQLQVTRLNQVNFAGTQLVDYPHAPVTDPTNVVVPSELPVVTAPNPEATSPLSAALNRFKFDIETSKLTPIAPVGLKVNETPSTNRTEVAELAHVGMHTDHDNTPNPRRDWWDSNYANVGSQGPF